ncbi:restriction endonuclease subunit S [Enterococcus faecium]|uniref:restriction endonuclease subunit S n=1 Tax=Enterococcus faecium TaxID=1352 RepID=UPI00115C34C2|nr:restriction endonuclease subunit S [Enterococcus faecium]
MSNDTRPEIRFPGFTEDWEERKLGELTESFDGKRVPIDSDLRISGKYPYYGATGIIDYVDDYIFNGEYVLLAEDGANIIMRNYPVAYLTQGKFWLNNHAHIMRMRNGSNYFLVQVLEKIDYKKYNTGTAQPKLNSKIVKNIELKIPHIEEQQQIGNFFKQLDDIIALHQRKLDLLKETKKGFLQKMFPKNGAKVPEIRFPGFTEDWEQRTLGDILKEFSIKSKVENEYTVLSSTNSGMEIRNGRVSGVSNLGYKIIENGDLVLSPQNLWLGNININNVGTGLVSPSYKTFKFIKVDPGFIRPQLRTARMLEEYKNSSTQGASVVRRNLELGSFYQITIKIPSDVEQGKIGLFFKQLDNLIALHQRKLDLLKETKKGFLQKMFV